MVKGEGYPVLNPELERIQSVPLVFTFGPHGDYAQELGGLNHFKDAVISPLTDHESGKVLIAHEFTNHSIEERDQLLQLIQEGALPSDVIVTVYDAYAQKRLSDQDYERSKAAGFSDWFHRSYREILDEAFTRFPERVELMPEWAPHDEINQEGFSQGTQSIKDFIQAEKAGDIINAFRLFKEMSLSIGENARRREKRIISDIKGKLISDPTIIGVVGYFGRGHTGLALELKKQGFAATRFIADVKPRPGRVPLDRVPRSVRFLPEGKHYSEEDWERIFEKVTGIRISSH